MFFLPLKRFASLGWFGLPKEITFAKIFIVLTFVLWLINVIIKKDSSLISSPFRRALNTAVLLYLVVSTLSIFNATVPGAALAVIAKRVFVVILCILIANIACEEKIFRNAIIAYIMGNVLHPLSGIYEFITGKPIINTENIVYLNWREGNLFQEEGGIRIQGLSTDPDYQAYILVIAIGIVLATIFNSQIVRSKMNRILLFVLFILMMGNIFLASSRTGWIGILITVSTFVSLVQIRHKKRLVLGVLFLASTTFACLAVFSNTPMLLRLTGSGGQSSISLRLADLKLALSAFRSHPILGIGTGNAPIVKYRWFKTVPGYTEVEGVDNFMNGYLQILAENGLIGFSVYLFVIFSFIFMLIRLITSSQNHWQRTMALGLLSSFLGHLAMLIGYFIPDSEFAWMVMGLGMVLFQFHEAETKEMSNDRASSWMGAIPYPQRGRVPGISNS
ncbi:MAG: O-antigen ligase family protein [Deltaproteobacteria bacterium]|nr:O-antigen ligase family protein [Deltaproteobacteria bacterium]